MQTYPIPMVPGPVSVPAEVLDAYRVNYGSADLEPEFGELYDQVEAGLRRLMATGNPVAILSGEGMLALWAALKSCLVPGDRVLAVATGVFGDGIADMAAACGAQVRRVQLPYDQTLSDVQAVADAVEAFRPKMITAVHCETPSGTLNPLEELGRLKQAHGVPLLYVDAVSSIGGTPVAVDRWHIDLCLGASQKCLSSVPDTAFVAVSDAAWEVIEQVGYRGYDALLPFRTARGQMYFPYTPNWHALAALKAAIGLIVAEGLENCFARHAQVAEHCRRRLTEMGFTLYPAPGAVCAPTVTAVRVPEAMGWEELDRALRAEGLVVGGSFGPLAGKVFRLGHMGTQADRQLVDRALGVIERVAAPRR